MPDKQPLQMGPQAAENRTMLTPKERELFDWFTERLHENALFYGSMIQGYACLSPSSGYWKVVAAAKKQWEHPDFPKLKAAVEGQARVSVTKKSD